MDTFAWVSLRSMRLVVHCEIADSPSLSPGGPYSGVVLQILSSGLGHDPSADPRRAGIEGDGEGGSELCGHARATHGSTPCVGNLSDVDRSGDGPVPMA